MNFISLLEEVLLEQRVEVVTCKTERESLTSFYDHYYISEEEQHAESLIQLIVTKREKSIEAFLKSYDNYFGFSLVEEGIRYTCLNHPVYVSFSKEQAMEMFENYIDTHEYDLTSPRFLKDFFSLLKKSAILPNEYELHFATNKPEEKWEGIRHCVIYKGDKVIHSRLYKDIIHVLNNLYNKAYVDIFVLEQWADDVFCAIEEEEKEKHSI